MDFSLPHHLAPGHALARGVWRHLATLGHAAVPEFTPARGLRCDLTVLNRDGEIWIIECKSSRADFMGDTKWRAYLSYCDRFFWAVDAEFPTELLPAEHGLFICDAHDAALIRQAPLDPVNTARRKAQTLKIARTAAARLHRMMDPMGASS